MSDKQYYVFVERNDNEGETWCFYLPLTVEEYDHLAEVLSEAGDEVNDTYELGGPITEENIDVLLEYGNVAGGYYDPHTKCTGVHDVFELEPGMDDEDLHEALYKGQYWKTR